MSGSEINYVSTSCLGLIISEGDLMIKDISQQTGCCINIQKDEIDGDKTGASLGDSASSIDQAKSQITKIAERRRENNGSKRSYGNSDRGYKNDGGYGYIDRDMNKDSTLNREEVQSWLRSEGFNRIVVESEHIVHKADARDDRGNNLCSQDDKCENKFDVSSNKCKYD